MEKAQHGLDFFDSLRLPTGENDFLLFYTAAWKKSRGKGKIIRKEIVVPWPSRVGVQGSNGGA